MLHTTASHQIPANVSGESHRELSVADLAFVVAGTNASTTASAATGQVRLGGWNRVRNNA